MMNVVIEENAGKILKVGDILMDKVRYMCIVVQDDSTDKSDKKYKIKRIDDANSNAQLYSSTLSDLTRKALNNNYKIYSQDEYELVIRKKK